MLFQATKTKACTMTATIIEYFYPKRALENAEGKPLAEMIRSVSDALPVKSSKTRPDWPSARRLTAVQSVSIVCTTAAERTSMLLTTRIWAREKVRKLTAGILMWPKWTVSARRMLFISRILFIIIQIMGKTKSRENIPFLEQMRLIQHTSM